VSQFRARILGSGAGGGVPQWNCACENCKLVRAGDRRITARTQDSIALTASEHWLLVNASPDVLRQVEAFSALHPQSPRLSPIAGVVLTNGDLDHVAGLLSLRESTPLVVLATDRVRAGLVQHNAVLRTLNRFDGHVTWVRLELGREVALERVGLGVTAVPAPGKLPIHLMGVLDPSPEDNVALRVRPLGGGPTCVVATAVGTLDGIERVLEGASTVFFDGTFWAEDELVALGMGKARARDMAHVPVGGDGGSLARAPVPPGARRVYTHINNTNPILLAGSPEREAVEKAGWEIAYDGMEIAL
jgi:pyrroloquinoline quinone biosynthesis protein B